MKKFKYKIRFGYSIFEISKAGHFTKKVGEVNGKWKVLK